MRLPPDNSWHFCHVHASEYRSIFWSETEQEYLQNCLFNFTAQLYSVQGDIMKLIWVRERSIIPTDQAEMKNKIIQSDNFSCNCWLCQADVTKMATFSLPSSFKIYSFKRTSGMYTTRHRAILERHLPESPGCPLLEWMILLIWWSLFTVKVIWGTSHKRNPHLIIRSVIFHLCCHTKHLLNMHSDNQEND